MTEETGLWAPYLNPGKRVLWEGRPPGRLFLFRGIDVFFVSFSIVWAMGATAAVLPALKSGAFFFGFGLIFLVAAVYVTIGRFLHDQYLRRRTVYAVTDKRAMIAKSAFGRQVRDLPITPALPVAFRDAPRGSVWLGERPGLFSGVQALGWWHGDDGGFTFRDIDAPREVYGLIQRIKRGEA